MPSKTTSKFVTSCEDKIRTLELLNSFTVPNDTGIKKEIPNVIDRLRIISRIYMTALKKEINDDKKLLYKSRDSERENNLLYCETINAVEFTEKNIDSYLCNLLDDWEEFTNKSSVKESTNHSAGDNSLDENGVCKHCDEIHGNEEQFDASYDESSNGKYLSSNTKKPSLWDNCGIIGTEMENTTDNRDVDDGKTDSGSNDNKRTFESDSYESDSSDNGSCRED
jgi:hypothetical protein